MKIKIAIVGAGWYGCHLAKVLSKEGYAVTLFERNQEIFSELSGKFGIRLHAGPHYPRSKKTRKNCHEGFTKFIETYPQLIRKNCYSIYGLGELDSDGLPSKVSQSIFDEVCREFHFKNEINIQESGYKGLMSAADLDEPSIVGGNRVRHIFSELLIEAGVDVQCSVEITAITKIDNGKIRVTSIHDSKEFDHAINATSYQDFLPNTLLPFEMEVVYQPCLALIYSDLEFSEQPPFSFIVMDGWFPCLMPMNKCNDKDDENLSKSKYILTHGKWTILSSCKTVDEATEILNNLTDEEVETKIKTSCEQEINRFWPIFSSRFKYSGWNGGVLAKLRTDKEFRSAVTFRYNGIIHIIPGKISNIFDVEFEIKALVKNQEVLCEKNIEYVKDGVLFDSQEEIREKPLEPMRSTCDLKTIEEIKISHLSTSTHTIWQASSSQENKTSLVKTKNGL